MDPYLKALAKAILGGMLPYPDSRRRRRVRRAARALVVCEPWPSDAETTGPDAAQLALLRVLYLQKQTRRAAVMRMPDATVQMARSSLEACLVGLYCLHTDDAIARLREAKINAAIDALSYLLDLGLVPKEVLDDAVAALGRTRTLPQPKDMAELADAKLPGSGVISLYKRFYKPTSTFFVHANAASLLRHVTADNTLTDKPRFPWTYRSAVRVADCAVGLLAAAVAEHAGEPSGEFAAYGDAHIARAFTPVAVVFGKGMRHSKKPSRLLPFAREVLALRRYTHSDQITADAPEVRRNRIHTGYATLTQLLAQILDIDLESPEARAFQPMMDYFTARILSDLDVEGHDPARREPTADRADGAAVV
jgi:hypothetical protein